MTSVDCPSVRRHGHSGQLSVRPAWERSPGRLCGVQMRVLGPAVPVLRAGSRHTRHVAKPTEAGGHSTRLHAVALRRLGVSSVEKGDERPPHCAGDRAKPPSGSQHPRKRHTQVPERGRRGPPRWGDRVPERPGRRQSCSRGRIHTAATEHAPAQSVSTDVWAQARVRSLWERPAGGQLGLPAGHSPRRPALPLVSGGRRRVREAVPQRTGRATGPTHRDTTVTGTEQSLGQNCHRDKPVTGTEQIECQEAGPGEKPSCCSHYATEIPRMSQETQRPQLPQQPRPGLSAHAVSGTARPRHARHRRPLRPAHGAPGRLQALPAVGPQVLGRASPCPPPVGAADPQP